MHLLGGTFFFIHRNHDPCCDTAAPRPFFCTWQLDLICLLGSKRFLFHERCMSATSQSPQKRKRRYSIYLPNPRLACIYFAIETTQNYNPYCGTQLFQVPLNSISTSCRIYEHAALWSQLKWISQGKAVNPSVVSGRVTMFNTPFLFFR